ncbi:type I methionyl aminopeptidase [Candidatus Tachikawaea gelatinosa]|uniref:Methionine aminopeptidase n=1 Tax=Candidatus Tachikawaea gelatinosa TaxID=1410383 RepID=A0A090AQ05_9ENTR|nr:type I methionyl aminopeptidase [Candidatus Tachikawaea gelatinosa]BAP58392.1 methionine aminopeptidase [Candidatus Tachikawaea gelatinosa]
MPIFIKNEAEIKKIRIASTIAADVLEMIEKYIKPGISTEKLDTICSNYILYKKNAISACLGYLGFPKSTCISVNDVVCHGIPNNKKLLKNGDIVNIDVAIIKNKWYSDTSKMYFVGKPTILGERLCKITQEALYLALKKIKPGICTSIIGKTIQNYVEKNNFSVVRNYCGHGIGKNFHEDPQILHYFSQKKGIILKPGMVFTVEPMINAGNHLTRIMKDKWTVKTKDRSLSAQYEHTVLVTKTGCEILTLRKEEKINSQLIN